MVTQDEFKGEKPPCDLVMKGGGVSDVAYPLAIVELAKKYRFSSVGGTSAGALAAAIAAAAEYARETKGFQRVAAISDEIAASLFDQFQPAPRLRPLFNMLTASLVAKWFGVISSAVAGYPGATLAGLLPGLLIVIFVFASSYGWLPFGFLFALVGGIVLLALRVMRALTKELPEANFGLCSGQTVPGGRGPGMTDWLADTIDRVAGNVDEKGRLGRPLTFGDLKTNHNRCPIELAMITTDLSMKRPYQLPFRDGAHFFSKADFAKLFPARVMKHMCGNKGPRKLAQGSRDCPDDLYPFPEAQELPIVVAARMSLSVPLLFQAVPVYKCDLTLRRGSDQPRKCLFSDGGLSSNFPIHFFDRLWPNSPTFAISFDEFSKERHVVGNKEIRVEMATDLREGDLLPIIPISGIGRFLGRLLDAARDWHDNLQSVLPGYRERIVHVHLKPDEGGYNLKMPPPVVQKLTRIGKCAGALAAGPTFNMDEHRWRRFLISMAEMEQQLEDLIKSHDKRPVGGESFGAFLNRYGSNGSYQSTSEARKLESEWKLETLRRAKELVALGNRWRDPPTVRSGKIPKPECDFRIVPKQ